MSRTDDAGVKHARWSASESKRWLNCPGSIAKCDGLPDMSGNAAKEGTCAHHLVNYCLSTETEAFEYLGFTVSLTGKFVPPGVESTLIPEGEFRIVVDDDCASAVQVMLDTVAAEMERLGPGTIMVLEHRFDLTWLRPDMFGTADVALISPFCELVVIDYKHGRFVGVEVEDNTQTKYYGVGVLHDEGYDFERVKTVIVQPRMHHEDGPVRDWTYDVPTMRAYEKVLADGVDATLAPDAPLVAGEWCLFCNAGKAGLCEKLKQAAFEAAQLDFSAVGTMEVQHVPSASEAEMWENIAALPLVKAWARGVEARMKADAIRLGRAYGKKVVRKYGRRTFVAPTDVVLEKVREAAQMPDLELLLPAKTMSPSQVEKIRFGKRRKFVLAALVTGAGLVERPEAGLMLVDENDTRYEEVTPEDAAAADFDAIMPGDEE